VVKSFVEYVQGQENGYKMVFVSSIFSAFDLFVRFISLLRLTRTVHGAMISVQMAFVLIVFVLMLFFLFCSYLY
jgi:hypothetical protein